MRARVEQEGTELVEQEGTELTERDCPAPIDQYESRPDPSRSCAHPGLAAELQLRQHVRRAARAKELIVAAHHQLVSATLPASVHDPATAGERKAHGSAPMFRPRVVEALRHF